MAICLHSPDGPNGYLSNRHPSHFEMGEGNFPPMGRRIVSRRRKASKAPQQLQKLSATVRNQTAGQEESTGGYDERLGSGIRPVVAYKGLIAEFPQIGGRQESPFHKTPFWPSAPQMTAFGGEASLGRIRPETGRANGGGRTS